MTKLEIVQVGTPVLRQLARPLTPEEIASPRIQTLIEDMRDTMRAAPGSASTVDEVRAAVALEV